MEGRDIGTKVFPDADLKIFLDADPVIREQRRLDQQKVKGAPAEAMAAELRERDRRDRTRAASPLVAAQDAVVLDSTNMSEDEVVDRIEELVEQRLAEKPYGLRSRRKTALQRGGSPRHLPGRRAGRQLHGAADEVASRRSHASPKALRKQRSVAV